jgi:L-amino acid N-acyltransferase YncA
MGPDPDRPHHHLAPGRAELSVEVVDAWHGLGVGTRLLRAARDRAPELGHRELVADVLVETSAMRALDGRRVGTHRRHAGQDDKLGLADLSGSLTA